MTVKKAQVIKFFVCEHCASVHIGLFRNGKMFAEAIPVDIAACAQNFADAIEESHARQQAGAPAGHRH